MMGVLDLFKRKSVELDLPPPPPPEILQDPSKEIQMPILGPIAIPPKPAPLPISKVQPQPVKMGLPPMPPQVKPSLPPLPEPTLKPNALQAPIQKQAMQQQVPTKIPSLPPLPSLSAMPPVQRETNEPKHDFPSLPDLEDEPPMPKSYEIPPLDFEEEIPLPPLDLNPKPVEEHLKLDESHEMPDIEIQETKQSANDQKAGPIFVKVDEYRHVLDSINEIKEKVRETDYVTEALNDIKIKVDAELEKWREDFEEMQRKLLYMDKVLFEGNKA